MKLLVQEKLSVVYEEEADSNNSDFENTAEFWKYITDLLDSFSVHYNLEHRSDYWLFEIPEQKINLSEQNMNKLFFECLYLLEYNLEYAALGGAGCDFALELYSKS